MTSSGAFNNWQETDYDAWRVTQRSMCGQCSIEGVEPEAFAGLVRRLSLYGCAAIDLSCNCSHFEHTSRDVRFNGMEHYCAMIQLSGRSALVHDGRIEKLTVGDIALVDLSRAETYLSHNGPCRWVNLYLPRQALISHLGLTPRCGSRRGTETLAGRVLFQLIQYASNECESSLAAAESYMHLAIYDLLGALFATPDLPAPSSLSNKLFTRVCSIIKTRFTAPDFGPREAAAEAGISLRYLQKLFTARGTSCTNFLRSVRLDHAACQLHRRTLLGPRRPISEIAYASGFNDYTHFARQFRRRFGRAPGAHSPDHGHPWRSRAAEETPSAHDVYLSASWNVLESVPVDEIHSSHSNDSLWALRKTRAIRKDAA